MNVLDLFSGIGGFSLGLERAGMRTVAFCEIDPFCRRVLAKHWPGVPCYDDITTLTAARLAADGTRNIDVICGGFSCQDISVAGKGAGIEGSRSGLWSEYARIIGEVRPRYVIVENVAALLGRGLERVLGDLAALGYDAEWHCIPAAAIGAPHRRDRIWIIAYPFSNSMRDEPGRRDGAYRSSARSPANDGEAWLVADAAGSRCERGEIGSLSFEEGQPLPGSRSQNVADADSQPSRRLAIAWGECGHWLAEPDVGRVAHGVTARVDRLRSLGNAVVPQIPEMIGRAIMRGLTQ
jgi:DNA (cytosine-5)-methyltransferase 1